MTKFAPPLLLALITVSACATTDNPRIEILRSDAPLGKECGAVGAVRGESLWGREYAEADLRNAADALDATLVVLSKERDAMGVVELAGEAYACKSTAE